MVAVNLTTALNSVELLKNQVKTLINIVKNSPEIRQNRKFMRALNSICKRLPVIKVDEEKSLFDEYSVNTLMSQLAVLNEAASLVKEFDSHKESMRGDMSLYENFL